MPLTPYLPIDRLLTLMAGGDLPDRAYGVALFADLSGFTPLAENLARQLGPQRGAEELTRQLDRVYAVLVGEAERFAGVAVSFSGDAITCWFDDRDAGGRARGGSAMRALAAALAMQQGMRDLAPVALPDGVALTLGVKVALAGGPIRRFAIGDPAFCRFDVLAGATLDLLSAIERLACRDEVLLDVATARALSSSVYVAEWRADAATGVVAARVTVLAAAVAPSTWPRPPASPAVEALARPWLLQVVASRLMGGSGAANGSLLADSRRVVALFLSFRGINYDDDADAPARLDAFVRRVQAVAASYEGALLQLTMGDKGSYLYLAFGAPVAQASAASNAVAAAHDLAALAPQLGFIEQVRIGIARGQMYCGDYGGPTRRTYGVLGDATNVAARLMSLAPPGGIRCDEEVFRSARRRWAFIELPPVRLKGKRDPVRIFAPTAPASPAVAHGAAQLLLGRDVELARLDAALGQLRAGRGGALMIAGEAGVGKSLLAGTMARLADQAGCLALQGAALSNERQTPYRAWRDIIVAFFELDDREDPAVLRERVQRAVAAMAPHLSQRAPLLNDVLRLGLADTPLTAALDARLRQESLLGLIVALLRERLREVPLLLLLEDAQWLDSLSWQLTVGVARALLDDGDGAPLLLALVHRPAAEDEAFAAHLAAMHALPNAETLLLEGLDDEASAALAARRLGIDPRHLPAALGSLLRERAAGNPFFVEELVDNLRDGGLITVVQGEGSAHCRVSPDLALGRAPLPETVEGLVLARIDRLPAEQQSLLKVAAVIGRSFGETPLLATLRRYALIERPALIDYLESLSRRDLTLPEATEPERTYIFKHSITHRVAYETLLFGQRAEIHGAVAAWYEANHAERIDAYYALLAYHYHLAGDRAGEARFTRLAGMQAAALYASGDALPYLSRALELMSPDDLAGRFELLLLRERVYDVLARREEQAADVRALEALAERLADDGLRVQAALRRSIFAERVSDFATGARAAARAAALALARAD
ncbi:MAG: AAA family ATPase, partial [Chloroflexales bacterium]|nr:AAA family ATPase [Chloroflexales bacterium]